MARLILNLALLCFVNSEVISTKSQFSTNITGLVALGGYHGACLGSAEAWLPPPQALHCSLPSLPYISCPPAGMYSHTVDVLEGRLVVCHSLSCLQLTPEGWQDRGDTLYSRRYHTSAMTSEGLLLMGGSDSGNTTELLSGGERFTLDPGRRNHCSIQVSDSKVVLTGGSRTYSLVSQHTGLGEVQVTSQVLPSLLTGRRNHGCGGYRVGEEQVLLVTGGEDSLWQYLGTTELYRLGSRGGWRKAGSLPSPRYGLRAASVGPTLHVTGGWSNAGDLADILSWDPVTETWAVAGALEGARSEHAVTEVSLELLQPYCNL